MKIATLFLAAVLGSAAASPMQTQDSIEARKQRDCDCSKEFYVDPIVSHDEHGEVVETCPAGYRDISYSFSAECAQKGCSWKDHRAKCIDKPQGETAPEKCDCSKPLRAFVSSEMDQCPAGYKDISPSWIPDCVQNGCLEEDYEDKCGAGPQVAAAAEEPAAAPEKPAEKPADADEQKTCDCSKPLRASVMSEMDPCPAGYKSISMTWIPDCVQIGCSEEDYEGKCSAKPQEAAAPEEPAKKEDDCNCSQSYSAEKTAAGSCPAGYDDQYSAFNGRCSQAGCSVQNFFSKCLGY